MMNATRYVEVDIGKKKCNVAVMDKSGACLCLCVRVSDRESLYMHSIAIRSLRPFRKYAVRNEMETFHK